MVVVLILSIILYGVWQHGGGLWQDAESSLNTTQSKIEILHATYGMDCESAASISGIFADNVKNQVVALCEGNASCHIPVNRGFLGDVFAIQCFNKNLLIEYRCYAFDKKKSAKGAAGTLTINCDNSD